MRVVWTEGPPPGRGTFWIANLFEGVTLVDLVSIGPAHIHRHDPVARLLVKFLGGLAYPFDANLLWITHHARVETPEAP